MRTNLYKNIKELSNIPHVPSERFYIKYSTGGSQILAIGPQVAILRKGRLKEEIERREGLILAMIREAEMPKQHSSLAFSRCEHLRSRWMEPTRVP
jgi:hypothetical protein